MDHGRQGGQNRACILRSAQHNGKIAVRTLIERLVLGGPLLLIQARILEVFHHADNLANRGRGQLRIAEFPSNWVFPRKVLLRKCLVDENDLRLAGIVGIGKEAPALQLDLQGLKQPRTHLALIDLIVDAVVWLAHEAHPIRIAIATDGKQAGGGCGLDARQASGPLQHRMFECDLLLVRRESGRRQADIQRSQMVGSESKILMQQLVEALAQQARARQQHHGGGQLDHHQVGSHAPPQPAGRPARALRQTVSHVRESEVQNRREGKQNPGQHSQAGRENQHAGIQSQAVQKRHPGHPVLGDEPAQSLHAEVGKPEPHRAA